VTSNLIVIIFVHTVADLITFGASEPGIGTAAFVDSGHNFRRSCDFVFHLSVQFGRIQKIIAQRFFEFLTNHSQNML
jgi:hypothetical protein